MLQRNIYKDIRNEYEEKVIAGMSIRRFVSLAIGIVLGVVVAGILMAAWGLDQAPAMYVGVFIAIPVFYLGWAKPKGMRPEEYIPLLFDDLFQPQQLAYVTERQAKKHTEGEQVVSVKKGEALYEPSEYLQAPKSKANLKRARKLWNNQADIRLAERILKEAEEEVKGRAEKA